jgi:hypothetical protein
MSESDSDSVFSDDHNDDRPLENYDDPIQGEDVYVTEPSDEVEFAVEMIESVTEITDKIQLLTRRGSELWTMCQKCKWRRTTFHNWIKKDRLGYNRFHPSKHHLIESTEFAILDQLYFDMLDLILPVYQDENRTRYKYNPKKSRAKNEKQALKFKTEIPDYFQQIILLFKEWNEYMEFDASESFHPKRWKDIYKPKEELCVICLCTEREIVLHPCMHCCLCKECYLMLPRKRCPLCRKVITDVRNIDHHVRRGHEVYRSQVGSIQNLIRLLAELK